MSYFNSLFRSQIVQSNFNDRDQQQQIQQQQTRQSEQVILNRYYVYQSLENLTNLCYSFQAVKDYFKDDPYHPMINICLNKIILQLNISNSILFDLERSSNDSNELNDLLIQKQQAAELFKLAIKDLPYETQQQLEKYFAFFLESLKNNTKQKQLELVQTNRKSDFNEKVVQNLISGIQTTDQKIYQIKQRKQYDIPSISSIKDAAYQFQQRTNKQLSLNFPDSIQNDDYKRSSRIQMMNNQKIQQEMIEQSQFPQKKRIFDSDQYQQRSYIDQQYNSPQVSKSYIRMNDQERSGKQQFQQKIYDAFDIKQDSNQSKQQKIYDAFGIQQNSNQSQQQKIYDAFGIKQDSNQSNKKYFYN